MWGTPWKALWVWPAMLCLLAATSACSRLPPPAPTEIEIRAMTYNLKNPSSRTENRWVDRRPIMKNLLMMEDPDIFGTQEGFYFQVRDIAEDLKKYDWIGEGRGGGSRGELMAIFYKRDRFEPIAYDHFWLSDTPNVVGSRTWGHDNIRMVTWVRFKERETGTEFYFWNTHFDHRVQHAREESAKLIVRRIRSQEPRLPVIVTGDFNAAQDNVAHATMISTEEGKVRLLDSWDTAKQRENEGVSTGHGWGPPRENGRRIDWILVSPEFEALHWKVILYKEGDQWPSDHFPVMSVLRLPISGAP